LNVNNNNSTKA